MALGVNDNKDINRCIVRLMMVTNSQDDETAQVCVEAFDAYLSKLSYVAATDMQAESAEQSTLTMVKSASDALENFKNENGFKAGQNVAAILKDLFVTVNDMSDHRYFSATPSPYDVVQILLGINDQLVIANDQDLSTCVNDTALIESVVKGLIVAVKEKNIAQSVQDILQLVSLLPGVKGPCGNALKSVATYVGPIEQAYKKDPKAFVDTIQNNLQGNPFGVALAAIKITQDLKSGKDYNAGKDIGALIQMAMKGILSH
jgi:hypothetical protein